MSGRRRRRPLRDRLAGRRRNRPMSTDAVIVAEVPAPAGGACIDLTNDDDGDFVDLTNTTLNDTPVVVIGSNSPPRRRRRLNPRRRPPTLPDLAIESTDSDVDTLPDLPFDTPAKTPSTPNNADGAPTSAANNESLLSPPGRTIVCPICLENDRTIRRSGNQLMSTICGHVFCKTCIAGAVNAQKKCPNCRKKLTMRQVHPLFI